MLGLIQNLPVLDHQAWSLFDGDSASFASNDPKCSNARCQKQETEIS